MGHQWWWGLRYVSDDPTRIFTTANEIHIPTGKPVRIELNSVDVIHSFDTDDLTEIPDRDPGLYRVDYTIPGMFLKSGIYSIRVGAGTIGGVSAGLSR